MKRFRVKLVGFGLAALAGSAVAADGNWLPSDPLLAGKASVVRAGGEPAQLPAAVRFASASEPAAAVDPIWLPATNPAPVLPVPTTRTPLPDLGPAPSGPEPLEPASNQVPQVVPRANAVPSEPTRDVPEWLPPPASAPVPPRVNAEPAITIPVAPGLRAEPQQPPPGSDAPVPGQPKVIPQPAQPGIVRPPSNDLPPPRPVAQPTGKELPVAPPELMVPECAPGKHGTFGSSPIRLSKDYPSLSELCGQPIRDRLALRSADDRAEGTRGFIQGEYLLWWMSPLKIGILGTTNPDPNSFGFLNEPGTVPILGPGNIIGSTRQGFRVRGGLWLDDCGSCGIDGSIFVLGRRTVDAVFTSSQFGVITRPIFSPNPNVPPGTGVIGETGEAVTVPNVLAGSLSAHAESFLWGADSNVRHCIHSGCDWRLMGFAGYRYLNLSEEVSVTENILVVGTSPRVQNPDPVGTVIFVRDSFKTVNTFNGGQVGLTYERQRGRWSLDTRASIALGATHQELDIYGIQTRTRPGQPPANFAGGLLAAGPNLGHFTRDQFSVVPEVTFNVGYQVTPSLRVYVGYNFLYWTNVIRPGDQIDRVVDLTFVPNSPAVPPSGLQRPAPLFKQSDLWVTGINFGVQFRW